MTVRPRALAAWIFASLLLVALGSGCLLFYVAGDPYGDLGCTPSQKNCLGKCYEQSDPTVGCSGECSACNAPPNAQPACALQGSQEVCALGACNAQYGDCDQNPSNGCETHTIEPEHCGNCGTDCNDVKFCELEQGTNSYICSNDCLPPNTLCDDASICPDLESDTEHCGSCDNSCKRDNAMYACTNGTCTFTCNANTFNCGNDCVAPSNAACGPMCAVCSGQKECDTNVASGTFGTCILGPCDPGMCPSQNGRKCVAVDLTRSPNCGACGVTCGSGRECCSNGSGVFSCIFVTTGPDGGTSSPGGMTCNANPPPSP